ncbi:MAG: DUF881 domain-containing protein [Chloroflexi bacterium]|nr:DUF881 domain-containing protein [Chloroflexota bacterium]
MRGLALLLPTILLGLAIGIQWQTQATRSPIASRYSTDLADAATQMQREQDGLRSEVVTLRGKLDEVTGRNASIDERAAALKRQIDQLRGESGLTATTGAGVTVTLDDGRLPASAPRRSIELAIVHSQDITDVFNAAWKAGASGIAVNGERITSATACVGATIQINGRLMSPPFVVSVLGPADQLVRALGDPGELSDLKRRGELYGLKVSIDRAGELTLPAYTGPIPVRHASPAL